MKARERLNDYFDRRLKSERKLHFGTPEDTGTWAARKLSLAITHIENLTSGTQTRFMFENNCDAARAFLKELNDE